MENGRLRGVKTQAGGLIDPKAVEDFERRAKK